MITSDGGRFVMPFYLVCDVSWSMRGELPALCRELGQLQQHINEDPLLYDTVWLGVITFADSADVPLQLEPAATCRIPDIDCAGLSLTQYGAAFRMLAKEWAQDYAAFNRDGIRPYRPCAYFLTDGEPDDLDWKTTFDETLSRDALKRAGVPGYPILVPFGFRDASESTLRHLAYPEGGSRWYHARNANIESSLTGLLGIIMNSVLTSGQSVAWGEPDHYLPLPGDPDISSGPAECPAAY